MKSLLNFSAIAALRGEGLHPKLRDLFERAATFPNSEVMHHDGMLQAGSPPASRSSEPLGDVVAMSLSTGQAGPEQNLAGLEH
jgi:hypothetical protein